jgi:soluble lytic murein transglycosylase-like protein
MTIGIKEIVKNRTELKYWLRNMIIAIIICCNLVAVSQFKLIGGLEKSIPQVTTQQMVVAESTNDVDINEVQIYKQWLVDEKREQQQKIIQQRTREAIEIANKYPVLQTVRLASRGGSEVNSYVNGPKAEIKAIILKESIEHNVPLRLVDVVCKIETGGTYEAGTSIAGARGIMQLMPATAKMLGVTDPTDPYQAIDGGTQYLRGLLDEFENKDIKDPNGHAYSAEILAGLGYNMGGGNLEKRVHNNVLNINNLPKETQIYYQKMIMYYKQ